VQTEQIEHWSSDRKERLQGKEGERCDEGGRETYSKRHIKGSGEYESKNGCLVSLI
jgi:hypothetical protein